MKWRTGGSNDEDRVAKITQMSREIDALKTLMDSEWWNANAYTDGFSLGELRVIRMKERNAV